MNRLVSGLLLVVFLVAIPMMAQNLPVGDPRNTDFLAHFVRVVAANPNVDDFYKMPVGAEYNLPDGAFDRLELGDTNGIWGREFQKWYGISYPDFLKGKTPVPVVPAAAPKTETIIQFVDRVPGWMWWLIALLGLAALVLIAYLIYNRRVLDVNPVDSGPSVVHGGVTDQSAPAAFQQMAARQWGHPPSTAVHSSTYQNFTVLRTTAGRIWGTLNVRYADGREVPRHLHGERAYRAEVRFPDGRTETLYMLQGCGNDLRYGGISRYLPGPEFRFEADHEVATAPTPAPGPTQPEPERPATPAAEPPTPAEPEPPATTEPPAPIAEPASTVEVSEDGVLKFELREAKDSQPAMARITGVDESKDFTCEIKPGVVVIRYHKQSK